MLSADLAEFVESAVTILVGTRDASLGPECLRVVGARVEPGREEITVFVPHAIGARTAANLRDNGRITTCFTRVADHRSIQIKGRLVALADADGPDRAVIDRYRAGLSQVLGFLGVPPRTLFRIDHWPCHAVRFRVESVFVQTPGPGAGDPLRAAEAGGAR